MRRIRQSRMLLAVAVAATMSLALGLPAFADLNLTIGGSAHVAYTNGDGVNVRNAPGYSGGVISTLHEATPVTVLDGPVTVDDGSAWFYVSTDVDGEYIEGWVIADYLASEDSGDGGDGGSHDGPAPVASDVLVAVVVNTDGNGLRLREGPSTDAATVTVMPEGAAVEVSATDVADDAGIIWAQVNYDGTAGFASQAYLQIGAAASTSSEPPAENPPADTVSNDSSEPAPTELGVGVHAMVTGTGGSGLNLRYEAGYDAGIITIVPEGDTVAIVDGPLYDDEGNAWYQVDYSSSIGWVHGGYLTAVADAPAADTDTDTQSNPPSDGQPPSEEQPVVGAESGVGASIVAEALNYVGVPYVWGGTTPAGFDCSGFTYFIINKVLNNGFSRDMAEQVISGSYVPSEGLSAGDLVFFQNTYKWGLSHVGIYVGSGTFVHSGSERTGVIVSNLWDSYWGPRYYTARRIAE